MITTKMSESKGIASWHNGQTRDEAGLCLTYLAYVSAARPALFHLERLTRALSFVSDDMSASYRPRRAAELRAARTETAMHLVGLYSSVFNLAYEMKAARAVDPAIADALCAEFRKIIGYDSLSEV